jgi:dCMP deaminase
MSNQQPRWLATHDREGGLMKRQSRDEFWFGIAATYATMATCPRASIGCVIMNPATKRQVGAGYNGAPAGSAHCTDVGCLMIEGADHCVRSTHAEINACQQVSQGMRNLVAYVVGGRDVCSHCTRELYAVGVRKVKTSPPILRLDEVLGTPLPEIVARKLAVNRARTWGTPDDLGVVEHIREAV